MATGAVDIKGGTLNELGYKIFLDRYALKDVARSSLAVGDTVIVVVDGQTGQREIGEIVRLDLPQVTVRLLDESLVERDVENVDKPLEIDPADMMDRVAAGVAGAEATPELRELWRAHFREALEDWKFVPAGRILTAAGTDQELTWYNCYVVPSPKDTREGIMQTLSQMTEIMSRGGGVGINISSLRPRHSYVRGVNGRSSGAVSWGALYSFVTGLIEQGGSRRGALMLILNDWHPDILGFIESKQQAGHITNANISVGVSDRLMAAVRADADWELVFPDTTVEGYDELWDGDLEAWQRAGRPVQHVRTVKARDIWNAIIKSAWASAEPGVWFRERTERMSNSHNFASLISTNPCGEQSLPAWGVCNLGAINLARFYDPETHDVDWETLGRTARHATRFLDNVIDSTPYFYEENRRQQLSERRVGLNNMGLAELMIRLGIRYGSDESVRFIDRLYSFLAREVYETSIDLAVEKGSFPQLDREQYVKSGFMQHMPADIRHKVLQNGIRNVTLLTQAPTGTTGTMVNTSTGIEPFFSWIYLRKSRLGLHEEQVPLVQEWFRDNPGANSLPEYFVTAMDLSPQEHVKVQAAIQRWVDSSLSKTCNVPGDYTVEQVEELYQYMYELGCKGGTIYRDGSRDEQVLMLADEDGDHDTPVEQVTTPHKVYPRPKQLQGVTVSRKSPFGTAYITINRDEQGNPFEVFIMVGKAGSDLQADAEGLGRMISLQLRTTAPANRMEMLRLVVGQLSGIGGARAEGMGPHRIRSLPDVVASVLNQQFFEQEEPRQLDLPIHAESQAVAAATATLESHYRNADMCPQCGTYSLIHTEGCRSCPTCGFSEC